jgi:NAD(P)-dependent dehydrogenase (short-subunit alcohol dehydrogenase family)
VKIADKRVLVTGANRGIGNALVDEALARGAARVFAGTRVPFEHADGRVTRLALDVTESEQVRRAVEAVDSLDVLINNAGVTTYDDLSERAAIEQQLAVNLFGTYEVSRAFLPLLVRSRGAIVNTLSLAGVAAQPLQPAYSVSKAAAFSLTQSLRALSARKGVRVHAVLAGPVDTDMVRELDVPKASPASVAAAILDGLENDEEDIFPDPWSATLADSWAGGPTKALERQLATLLDDVPVTQ